MANPYYGTAVPGGAAFSPYQQPTIPYATPVSQNMQPAQQQNSILTVFVSSEEEVNFYPVAAGVTVMLISFNLGKFWLKSTGKNGVPEPLRTFDFSENSVAPQIQNDGNFATKDELQAISNKLDKLITSLGGEK